MDIDILREKVKKEHQRLTTQRELVLKAFLEKDSYEMSLEEVFKTIKRKRVKVNKTTIQRVLECFTEYKILRKIVYENKIVKYELIQEKKEEQNHLICNNCGKVIDIKDEDLIQMIKKAEKETGFKINDLKVKYFGLCPECKINH